MSQDTHIMICTPVFGKQVYEGFMQSVLRFVFDAHSKGVQVTFSTFGDSLITRARDNLVASFLTNKTATHLLWIDADIAFEPDQVWRLFNQDKSVCVAAYPFKHYDFPEAVKDLPDGLTGYGLRASMLTYVLNVVGETIDPEDGFAEVYDGATGFMLIQRSALEEMVEHYPELSYKTDMRGTLTENQYLFYSEMIEELDGKNRRLSEDYAFCRRWQKMGGKIFLDLKSKLIHIGPHEFYGDLEAKLQVGALLQKKRDESFNKQVELGKDEYEEKPKPKPKRKTPAKPRKPRAKKVEPA